MNNTNTRKGKRASLSKDDYIDYIYKKLDSKIEKRHISAILNMFFDELKSFIVLNRKFNLKKFAVFKLKKDKDRRIFNIYTKTHVISKATNRLKIFLDPKIKQILIDHLDKEKTFTKE